MKEIYYIYNNEAIASCIFLAYFLVDDKKIKFYCQAFNYQ